MIARLLRPVAVAFGLISILYAIPAKAAPIETAADHALLIDYETGTVLLDKAADEAIPPAYSAFLGRAIRPYCERRAA